jgi:hypothetical protein
MAMLKNSLRSFGIPIECVERNQCVALTGEEHARSLQHLPDTIDLRIHHTLIYINAEPLPHE